MLRVQMGYAKTHKYEVCALAIIAIAVVMRVALVVLGWPQLDSDEGTIGIMAIHILSRGEHPVFFYHQGYMGALEAYIAAFFFSIFGISTFMLRFGLINLFALFLLGMYLLSSMLYIKKWALITIGLLGLGSAPMLTRELVAIGGYAETLTFGVFLLVIALWLAFSSHPEQRKENRWSRWLLYMLWGLVAGAAIWTDELVAPFILTGGLLLLIFCWRELLGFATVFVLIGLLIGASPLIAYNISAAPGDDTLSWLQKVQTAQGTPLPPFQVLFPQQLVGALLITMPGATGSNPLCYNYVSEVRIWDVSSLRAIHCTLMHTGWAIAGILLWIIAVSLVVRSLWQRVHSAPRPWSPEDRRSIVRQSGRFALLLNGLIVLLLFIVSPNAALYPVPDMRYLEGLLVTTPALLWPLWEGAGAIKPLALKFAGVTVAVKLAFVSFVIRRGFLVLIGIIFFLGTINVFTGAPFSPRPVQHHNQFDIIGVYQYLGVPETRAYNRQEVGLIQNLLRIGARHIISDYWTCDRVIFRSKEQIICTVQEKEKNKMTLKTGHNRYDLYYDIIRSDPHAAYVFPLDSPEASVIAQNERHHGHLQRYTFNGYVVYKPR